MDVFRLEAERIFYEQWFCVGRADRFPLKAIACMSRWRERACMVVRGRDDELRAFYNVCRHRGSQLVRTPALPDVAAPDAINSTRLSGAVTCPYHAWTYNLDGTLRAAPFIQFDASCPKERLFARVDPSGHVGWVHFSESCGTDAAAAARAAGRSPRADWPATRCRICAAAHSWFTTCARTGR